MSAELEAQIREQLSACALVQLGLPLQQVGEVSRLKLGRKSVEVGVTLGFPAAGLKAEIEQQLAEVASAAAGLPAKVAVDWNITAHVGQHNLHNMEQVRNIIAVASGKGGVGKSTTSVNLALALAAEGAKVGLLDADIYGPSQQVMLGVGEGQRPEQYGTQYLKPITAHGIQTMSMGYLVTEKTPMVWRGPMVSSALQQLLFQTYWTDLDYLIIDMPPGTGDAQLTLSQKVPVAGAVVVTTPQDIALLDAKKGIEMFRKVDVPVLGIVENMAMHVCSNCGQREHLFGSGGGQAIAEAYQVPLLGSLPLAISIREHADGGQPLVAAEPGSDIAGVYREVARAMAAEQARKHAGGEGQAFPNIVISND